LRAATKLSRQRGVAVVTALLLTTLAITIVASLFWQQQVQVRSIENQRLQLQKQWVLRGALDWARLILREDAQARYNLRNLFTDEGQPVALERQTLTRLCAAAGLGAGEAERLITGLAGAWRARSAAPAGGGASAPGTGLGAGAGAPPQEEDTRVLPVQRFEHLAWLGLEPAVLQALRPLVYVLPTRTPVNLNTAGREVLAAVREGLNVKALQQLRGALDAPSTAIGAR